MFGYHTVLCWCLLDIRKIDELASHGAAAVLEVVGEGVALIHLN